MKLIKILLLMILHTTLPNCRDNDFFDDDNCSECSVIITSTNCIGCFCPNFCGPKTFFLQRSQGANTARELVGWQDLVNLCCEENNYFRAAITFEYQQTFNNDRLAIKLFGTDFLSLVGSQVAIDNICTGTQIAICAPCCDLIADNFGLSTMFCSTLHFKPFIKDVILDFQGYWGLDSFCPGFYIRFNAPLVYTQWQLLPKKNFTCNNCQDNTEFPPCYMSQNAVTPLSLKEALCGKQFGDLLAPWRFGKFHFGPLSKFGLADIDFMIGYNFFNSSMYHFGLYSMLVIPTGNKPSPEFIFSPVVGNTKHWELGAGVSGHILLWDFGPEQTLAAYIEGNATHMFANTQVRSFDLNNGPLSRYLLLKELNNDFVYQGLMPGINFVTMPVQVSVKVKADFSIKLTYSNNNFSADLGYNIYGNTHEKLSFINNCHANINGHNFVIKGSEGVCCQEFTIDEPIIGVPTGIIDSLNSSQSNATICQNSTTDNPEFIASIDTICVTWDNLATTGDLITTASIAQSSNPPILLTQNDINFCSAASCPNFTHKIFAMLNYKWYQISGVPHFGIGSEVEFSGTLDVNKVVDRWGLWLKGGFSF